MKLWNWFVGKRAKPNHSTGSGGGPQLSCPTCGSVYRLGDDATIVTMQDVYNMVRSHGGTVIGQTRRTFATQTDPALIGRPRDMGRFKKTEVLEKVASIRATLKNGGEAFWYCEECKNSAQPHAIPADFCAEMHSLENLARGAETVTEAQEIAQFDRGCEVGAGMGGLCHVEIYPHVVSRVCIESADTCGLDDICKRAADDLRHGGEFLVCDLRYEGYSDDPREVFQIPEIRRWCKRALERAPFLPMLLSDGTVREFVFCVMDDVQILPDDGKKWRASFSLDEVIRILFAADSASHEFFIQCGVVDSAKLRRECATRVGRQFDLGAG